MRNDPADVVALVNAASTHPLPVDEVLARLGTAMQLHIAYLARRERRHIHTPTDVQMELEIEGLASAIHHLQRYAREQKEQPDHA
jgi:hypothetical protein